PGWEVGARGVWLLVAVAAAAVAAAAAETAPTAAGTAPAPVLTGLGLVDGQASAPDLLAVEGVDGLVAALGHLDAAEAARAAAFPVGDDLGAGDRAKRREQLTQVVGGGLAGQVGNV